jgi:2-dehydropantoate 2-reductase
MQQDLASGRLTEIDYITGYILRQAQPFGIQMPHHQKLYNAIKALEPRN